MEPLLEVRDLRVHYHIPQGPVRAVEDVSFFLIHLGFDETSNPRLQGQ